MKSYNRRLKAALKQGRQALSVFDQAKMAVEASTAELSQIENEVFDEIHRLRQEQSKLNDAIAKNSRAAVAIKNLIGEVGQE